MSEVKGLSILIPIYNYDTRALVHQLLEQTSNLSLPFEIRCYDDGSSIEFRKINQELGFINNIIYFDLPANIGRSAIRNKLVKDALYSDLILLDCDSKIVKEDFLDKYLGSARNDMVLIGGTIYQNKSNKVYSLRWKYGKAREEKPVSIRSRELYEHITMNNMFIKKMIFIENQLDESIRTYGHEDTKFGNMLKQKNIPILHIDNPIEHCGLEQNQAFIDKTLEGIKNYYKLIKEGYAGTSRLHTAYNIIKYVPLRNIFIAVYTIMESNIRKNLLSENPSLLYFDLFKLRALIEEKVKDQ
ncbi:MAG TPA: glycosyltransferase [Cytophagaceae bacterium]|jgi:hypothetical protein|nr:glycosyltransferase [Cytophagaceae bacterium]